MFIFDNLIHMMPLHSWFWYKITRIRMFFSVIFFINLYILLNICSNVLGQCPLPEEVAPCKCFSSPYDVLECRGIDDVEVLRKVFQYSEDHRYKQVHLSYLTLQYLPHEIFDHAKVEELYLENSTLISIFDSPPQEQLFLDKIHIENTTILNRLKWDLLEPFDDLRILNIYFNPIWRLDSEFRLHVTKNLQQLTFYSTDTEEIKPGILTEYTNLNKLAIDACKLTKLTRDMFPTPFNVRVLYFNDNKIASIPEDLFTQMPNLQTLGLRNNLITIIPKSAFEGNIAKITHVWLEGNPLRCNCKLEWLLISVKKPEDLRGTCNTPSYFSGRELKTFSHTDIICRRENE